MLEWLSKYKIIHGPLSCDVMKHLCLIVGIQHLININTYVYIYIIEHIYTIGYVVYLRSVLNIHVFSSVTQLSMHY